MLFEGRYKTQDYFRYFLHLFSVPSLIFSKNGGGGAYSYLPSKDSLTIHYLYSKVGSTYGHSIQYKMLLVRLHIDYIDLLKLKAYKLFEISDSFLKKPTCLYLAQIIQFSFEGRKHCENAGNQCFLFLP